MPRAPKVMVVEDDAGLRRMLVELLEIWGYEAETASDGFEALEKIQASSPFVVISDLGMPRMGGMELLRALRAVSPEIKCIIVSAEANAEKVRQAARLGIIDFLEKPVDLDRLRLDLSRCFDHQETVAAASALARRWPSL